MAAMGMINRYPETLGTFLARCHEAGQRRPTPLLLKYQTGDYSCLHQDSCGVATSFDSHGVPQLDLPM